MFKKKSFEKKERNNRKRIEHREYRERERVNVPGRKREICKKLENCINVVCNS